MSASLTDTLAAWRAVHEAASEKLWEADEETVGIPEGSDAIYIVADCTANWNADSACRANATAIALYHNTYAALLEVARGLAEWREAHAAALRYLPRNAWQADQMRKIDAILAPLTAAAEREA